MNAFAGLGALGGIFVIIIGALYALFPLIVMMQLSRTVALKRDLSDALKALELANKQHLLSVKQLTDISTELETQNTLTRQLLKAYGHEPEA